MKYFVDPPSGWRYGFPKVYDTEKDGNMVDWLVANGYPRSETEQPHFYIRQWEVEDPSDIAFSQWEHSHHPEQHDVQKRAFKAGWDAAKEHAA